MNNDTIEGLIVKGTIAGRSRRILGEKNLELVTYKVLAGDKVFFVKNWTPSDYFTVGEPVTLPIIIKTYQKNGHVMIDYTINSDTIYGEEF